MAVSGGFDPIHIGHIRMFSEAKKLGNYLVVILNNDNWLKAKKGYVFMSEKERLEVVESIKCVDEVVITKHSKHPTDMSVCDSLNLIKPDIFANGGDRYKKNIPELSFCKKISCKMVFSVGSGGKVQSSSWLLADYKEKSKLAEKAQSVVEKDLIVFDLDGTLSESKTKIDKTMAKIFCSLLDKKKVAVIGGGNYLQFQKQLLKGLKCPKSKFENLFLLPTSGGRFYEYKKNKWQLVYKISLTKEEKQKIYKAIKKSLIDVGYKKPKKVYGQVVEDRENQITFSALGQDAPLKEKEFWNKNSDVRPKIKKALKKYLPEFEIRLGGTTSLDITHKGIDKAYGVRQLRDRLNIPIEQMIYIGDALYPGGNDSAVLKTKIDSIQIAGPEDVRFLLLKAGIV